MGLALPLCPPPALTCAGRGAGEGDQGKGGKEGRLRKEPQGVGRILGRRACAHVRVCCCLLCDGGHPTWRGTQEPRSIHANRATARDPLRHDACRSGLCTPYAVWARCVPVICVTSVTLRSQNPCARVPQAKCGLCARSCVLSCRTHLCFMTREIGGRLCSLTVLRYSSGTWHSSVIRHFNVMFG